MKLLDGKQLAQTMQSEIAQEVAALAQTHGVRPGLAAVLVGDDAASQIYVKNSARLAESRHGKPTARTVRQHDTDRVARFGRGSMPDPKVHGILVQLPLPKQIDEATVVAPVSPPKGCGRFRVRRTLSALARATRA